jgi:hypothetical protein
VPQTFRFPSLNAFVFGDVAAALPGCTTIDRDNNDNGFLGCARGQNPGARLHGSTAESSGTIATVFGWWDWQT